MKLSKILFKTCLFLQVCIAYGQDDGGQDYSFDSQKEFIRAQVIPHSPATWEFSQYGDTPVDLYRGVPSINIPLYTIQGKEMNLPVSISYDPLNLKVESRASSVGFGWSLNVGGAIIRQTNGLSDDNVAGGGYSKINSSYVRNALSNIVDNSFNSPSEIQAHYAFLEDISNNDVDALPDLFIMNVNGEHLEFAYDVFTNNMICLNDPKIDDSFSYNVNSSSWEVESNGFTYHFNSSEKTQIKDSDDNRNNRTYVSSWFITKIISPNGKDVFEFSYVQESNPYIPQQLNAVTQTITSQRNYNGSISYSSLNPKFSTTTTKIDQVRLVAIKHNGKFVVNLNYSPRYDMNSNDALSQILFLNNSSINKVINLNQSYFGVPSGQNASTQNQSDIKLKLDSIRIVNQNSIASPQFISSDYGDLYSFKYNMPDQVPGINSTSQDLYGYHSQNSSGSMIPHYEFDNRTFGASSRSFDFNDAIKGILTKMTYPTGGFVEYEYERAKVDHTTPRKIIYNSLLSIDSISNSENGANCRSFNSSSPCLPCQNSTACPTSSPKRYDTSVFEVADDDNYDLLFNLYSPPGSISPIGPSNPLPSEIRAYVVEINSSTALSFSELIQVIENGTAVIWDLHGCDDTNTSNACHNIVIPLKKNKFYQSIIINNAQAMNSSLDDREDNFVNYKLEISRIEQRVKNTTYYPSYRIDKVKTYEKQGELALLTDYNIGGIIVNQKPRFSSVETFLKADVNDQREVRNMLKYFNINLYSKPNLGSGSVLNYTYASKSQINFRDIDSTKTVTAFKFERDGNEGSIPGAKAPFPNTYNSTSVNGRDKGIISFNKQGIIAETQINHTTTNNRAVYGVTVKNNPSNLMKVLRYINTSNGVFVNLEDKVWRSFGGTVLQAPQECSTGVWNCIENLKLNLEAYPVILSGKYGQKLREISNKYFDERVVVDTINYKYNSNNLLIEKEIKTSNDKISKISYEYGGFPESSFINEPVKIKRELNNEIVKESRKIFKKFDPVEISDPSDPDNSVAPEKTLTLLSKIQNRKGNNSFVDQVIFDRYDNQGNLLQSDNGSGVKTSYIWGYKGLYMVAKVENMAFENLPNILLNNIKLSSEEDLPSYLNTLRNHPLLSQSQMSSNIYNNHGNITSQTDSRGNTTYYEYDDQNRLKFVKDNDENILSKNDYNYKINN